MSTAPPAVPRHHLQARPAGLLPPPETLHHGAGRTEAGQSGLAHAGPVGWRRRRRERVRRLRRGWRRQGRHQQLLAPARPAPRAGLLCIA
jgi:hypothetical protein